MRCGEGQTDRLMAAARRRAVAMRRCRRRATVMIFVLGILSLLALIGLVLITRTHGEFRRVAEQSASSSSAAVRDGVVRKIREVLRLDIWGAAEQVGLFDSGRPLTNITPPNSTKNPLGLLENNEPWDASGESDMGLGPRGCSRGSAGASRWW